ncbi:hypothetical protein [Winogradskya humida]|uniref:Uncharacterized protein n=1 Tax=Winogradskya humida TaxID=113566 RepID=A0ABQ4A7J6_9ACTN|nr:hypothetical protein [Actinoplanes humidus]GIE26830.1 hypothetical protein Ahu01nite_099320 [Actinoplanes humidus]
MTTHEITTLAVAYASDVGANSAPPAATAALTTVAVVSSVVAGSLTLLGVHPRGGDQPGEPTPDQLALRRGAAVAASLTWLLTAGATGRWSPLVVLLSLAAAVMAAGRAVPRLLRLAAVTATIALLLPATAVLHSGGGSGVGPAVAGALLGVGALAVAAVSLTDGTGRSSIGGSVTAAGSGPGSAVTAASAPLVRRPAVAAVAVLTAVVVVAGLVVTGSEPPAPPAPAGSPVLRRLETFPGAPMVLIVPGRPGANVVHLLTTGAQIGTAADALTPTTTRPGAGPGWADVQLVPGRNRIWLRAGGVVTSMDVDAGPATSAPDPAADLPECAASILGGLLAGRPARGHECPADRLVPADVRALNATVDFLAGRKVPALALVADQSTRGTEAAAAVRAHARVAGLRVAEPGAGRMPLLIVSGWAGADDALRRVATNSLAAEGAYLAPWLLDSALLDMPAGQVTGVDFDPGGPAANAYLSALHAAFPGDPACSGGFRSFAGANADSTGAPVRLFASSRIVMPGMSGHSGHGGTLRWLPDGAVTAVTGPLS